MSKYNVGDKVLVKVHGAIIPYDLESVKANPIVTISKYIGSQDGKEYYRIKEDDNWVWADEDFVGKLKKIETLSDDYDYFNNYFKLLDDLYSYYNIENKGDVSKMPNIKNYTYNPEIALTTIEWSDGTNTTVRAENPETADQYTGFVTAVAKKAMGNGNKINNLFDEWTIKKPEREAKHRAEIEKAKEAERIKVENANKRREKHYIKKQAKRIAREYEAKKLAHEKYGVPFNEDKPE